MGPRSTVRPELAEGRPEARFATIGCPIRSIAITDDRFYAPRPAVEALLSMYPAARAELKVVTPAEAGSRAIGHFGFFNESHRRHFWPEAVEWLAGAARSDGAKTRGMLG